MKVQVSQKAGAVYGASLGRHGVIDWKWHTICRMIAGEVLEVETAHLFADQYNIAPVTGADLDRMKEKLLAEWGPELYQQRFASPTSDESKAAEALSTTGIRLTDAYVTAVMDDERPARYACGYCGAQTTTPERTGFWCDKCIGSEYLEPDMLHLLQLVPVMEHRNHRTRKGAALFVPPAMLDRHREEKARRFQEWQSKEYDRRAGRLAKFLQDQEKAHAALDRKTAVFRALYAAGIDAVKLGTVYYDRTDTAQIGAISTPAITADEVKAIREVLDAARAGLFGPAAVPPCEITIKGGK